MKFSEFEKEMGFTSSSIRQDVAFCEKRAAAEKEKALYDLFAPLREGRRRAAIVDAERAAAGLPPL